MEAMNLERQLEAIALIAKLNPRANFKQDLRDEKGLIASNLVSLGSMEIEALREADFYFSIWASPLDIGPQTQGLEILIYDDRQ